MKAGKRFFSILLALVMVVTLLPAPRAQAADFRDIEGHWARNNIADAVERGLFSGTSDSTFSPNAPMTRAMFVTVLYRMDDGIALGDSYFIDVDQNAWYYDAVCWASENELVAGTDTWHFSPNRNITREQMVAILYRYLDYANATLERTTNVRPLFYDRGKISSYAQDAVEEMQFAEIIRGKPAGAGYNFDPQGNATRAEAARVFCLFIDQIIWGEEELTSEEAAERMGDILADEELNDIAENWRAADTDAERESYAEEIIEYFETLKDMGEIDVLQVDRDNQTISYRIGELEGAYLLYDQAEHVVDTSDITFDFSGAASGSLVRDVYGSTGPVYGIQTDKRGLIVESFPASDTSEEAECFHDESRVDKLCLEEIPISYVDSSVDVHTGTTVEWLKTGLRGYRIIVINSHGGYLFGKPYICLEEKLGSYTNYLSDRELGRVAVYDGVALLGSGKLAVNGKFLSDYYGGPSLLSNWVHLGICNGMKNNDLAQGFRDAGAEFVTGYGAISTTLMTKWYLYYMQDQINQGKTLAEASAYASTHAIEEAGKSKDKEMVKNRPPIKTLGDGSLKLHPVAPVATGKLSIQLSPNSGTVTKGTVTVYKADGTTKVGTHTFTTSSFEIGELETGASYKLEIAADGFQPAAVTGKAADNPVTQVVKLTQLEGKISLKLVPDSGTVTGGTVATTKTAGLTLGTSEASTFTSSSFVIGALEPGAQYKVQIAADGYNTATVTVTASTSPSVTTVNLTAKTVAPITTKTVTVNVKEYGTGKALSGAAVTLYGGTSSSSLTRLTSGTTSSSGVFTATVSTYSVYKAEATLSGYVRGSTETGSTSISVTLSKEADLTPDPEPDPEPDPGIPEGYTPIYTAEEFAALKGDEKVILMKDLNLSGVSGGYWSGVLDGNGHTISGVKRSDGVVGEGDMGWMYWNTGTIRNVRFRDISIQYSSQSDDLMRLGLIAQNLGTIENCVIESGSVALNKTNDPEDGSSGGYAGGLVARNGGTIKNCVNKVSVRASVTIASGARYAKTGQAIASGLVADNYGTIDHCLNLGYISASSPYNTAGAEVRGVSYTSAPSLYPNAKVTDCGNGGSLYGTHIYFVDSSIFGGYATEATSGSGYTPVTLSELKSMWSDIL